MSDLYKYKVLTLTYFFIGSMPSHLVGPASWISPTQYICCSCCSAVGGGMAQPSPIFTGGNPYNQVTNKHTLNCLCGTNNAIISTFLHLYCAVYFKRASVTFHKMKWTQCWWGTIAVLNHHLWHQCCVMNICQKQLYRCNLWNTNLRNWVVQMEPFTSLISLLVYQHVFACKNIHVCTVLWSVSSGFLCSRTPTPALEGSWFHRCRWTMHRIPTPTRYMCTYTHRCTN